MNPNWNPDIDIDHRQHELDEHILRVLKSADDFPHINPVGGFPSILVNPDNPAEFTPEAASRIQFWQRELARSNA